MAGIPDYSTTAASNASVGTVNFAEGQAPSTVNDSARAVMADLASAAKVNTVSGTDTYTVSLAITPSAYSGQMNLLCQFTNANTGAATINVDSLGAKAIKKDGGNALVAGDIKAGGVYLLAYDSSAGYFLLLNPPAVGVQTIWVPASAMASRVSGGCATLTTVESTTNKVNIPVLDFDQTTDEYAQFLVRMPKGWNEGTITASFSWICSVTGDVVWGLHAVAIGDDDAYDAAFGTAQTVTDSVTATTDVMHSAATSAITIAGTPASQDLVVFQVYRDADNGSDTAAGDARLLGVSIFYTTDAATDA